MSSYLSSLTLSHFRSHKVTRLSLDSRPVALYGPNGSGKTNILEALSLFSPGRGLRRSSAQDMTRRPEALGWKISGVLQGSARQHEIEIFSHTGSARQLRLDHKATSQSALGRICRILWLVPAMDRLWIEGAEGRRRFLDRMTLSFYPDHGELSLTYEKAMRERNRLLKDMVRDAHWYTALELQMAEAGQAIHSNRMATLAHLEHAQKDAITAFPAASLRLTHPDAAPLPDTAEDFRQALAQHRPRDALAGRSLIGPHRADLTGTYATKGIPARDCSTGEQKALLVSLILANARALKQKTGCPPLLLLDEVAAHLDADRRAALYDEITTLGTQAWMSATERALFDSLASRAQYFKVTEDRNSSLVRGENDNQH